VISVVVLTERRAMTSGEAPSSPSCSQSTEICSWWRRNVSSCHCTNNVPACRSPNGEACIHRLSDSFCRAMLCPIGGLSARQFNSCMSAPKRREEEKSYAVVRWLGGWLARSCTVSKRLKIRPYCSTSYLEMVQDLQWLTNRKSHMICWTVLCSMTLNDR